MKKRYIPKHTTLINDFIKLLDKDTIVVREATINNKRYDLLLIKDNKLTLVEALVTKRLSMAEHKLEQQPKYDKIIIRRKKNRNPLARKIIKRIRSKGIQFIEL